MAEWFVLDISARICAPTLPHVLIYIPAALLKQKETIFVTFYLVLDKIR